ncbi:MAG: oxygen-insensitive NADPH nitroreductase [Proteobacteria bacterium]|nr:oxygen-insensitive NADPH nitroreductase [Pseudomonadota bacterium]MDA0960580.1 oxygen-insensitive NADPH nitroreductase [Pseudomonadota bacterium]MDA1152353.1 oxygen-insensitive NADPH nitroreductase [Pseudomonadota bacterium]
MNPTIELLKSHRSIRQFKDRPIAPDLLNEIILAGQAAASSNFLQAVTIIRITDRVKRARLAELAGNQAFIESAAEFLVFCADISRASRCCDWHGAEANTGFTEQFIIATVDVALVAQNIVVAAESAGLGICYIGALRNDPAAVSAVLGLPQDSYAVFGLCLGWPDQNPEIKPRLPLDIVFRENSYGTDSDLGQLADYDDAIRHYYQTRTDNKKSQSWSEQMSAMLSKESRPHMLAFLRRSGFLEK